jgi:hypothetical protein
MNINKAKIRKKMKQRKPAPPIFDTDTLENKLDILPAKPLPKIEPIDIQISDSEDSSSYEEITLNPKDSFSMTDINNVWEFIEKIGWSDKPRLTTVIKNRAITNFSQLNDANQRAFQVHIKNKKKKLDKAIHRKKLYEKFARKLTKDEIELFLLHIILRGKSFYETILDDPSPIGYLVGDTSNKDEFMSENIFKV